MSLALNNLFWNDLMNTWAPTLSKKELFRMRRISKEIKYKIELYWDVKCLPPLTLPQRADHLILMYQRQNEMKRRRIKAQEIRNMGFEFNI